MWQTGEGPTLPMAVVIGASIVGGILAVGWAIAKICPALGVMIGLAISVSTTGLSMAGGVAPWIVPAATAGLGIGGSAVVILVLVKAAKEAAAAPYEWTLPLLGIAGSVLLDAAKEFGIENPLVKVAVVGVIAFLIVVAGACWKSRDWAWKIVGITLLLVKPASLLIRNLEKRQAEAFLNAFHALPPTVWFRLLGFMGIGVLIIILHGLSERKDRQASRESK